MGPDGRGRQASGTTRAGGGSALGSPAARWSTAARELLEEQGYAATTVADVARRAGVSPESVYKGFGTKAALVKEVFDVVIAGDDEPVPVAERPEARAVRDEPDVREKLRLFAAGAAERAERSARVQLVIRNGAPGDPALDELWQAVLAERLAGMTMVAQHLAATRRAPGLAPRRPATCCGPASRSRSTTCSCSSAAGPASSTPRGWPARWSPRSLDPSASIEGCADGR